MIGLKKLILCLICITIGQTAWAQTLYSICGKVETMESEPLLGTNVKLTSDRKTSTFVGTTTDEMGHFELSVPSGNYTLEISFVGYATYVASVEVKKNVMLPTIRLSEDAQMLEAVTITAKTLTYHSNGYVAEISKNPFYRDQSMDNILKLTPGTYASHNQVQVYGKGVSKIYLNGRELKLSGEDLIEYLKNIEGKNVKRMEVVASSGVEEDAVSAGGSILKITTINPETGGMLNTGTSFALGSTTKQVTPTLNLQWRMSKKWSSYLNMGGATGEHEAGQRSEIHYYDTDIRRINESDNKDRLYGFFRTCIGLGYDWDQNNLFSIEGTFNTRHSSADRMNTTHELLPTFTDYQERAHGNTGSERKYRNFNLSFAYTHIFSSKAELTFKADRLENDTENEVVSSYHYHEGDNTRNEDFNTEDNLVHTLRADFTQKFDALSGNLSVGAKYANLSSRIHTDYDAFLNGTADERGSYVDRYRYTEDVYALYAKYGFRWKAFTFNAGLRMEHARLSPQSSVNPERNHTSHYTDLFPEAGISYAINKEKGHHLSFHYNRGLARPSMESLNPLVIRNNEYSYSMGNPFLKPYYRDNFSLTSTWFDRYILRLSYSQYKNGAISLTESDENGILYASSTNGRKQQKFEAYLSIPLRFGSWGNINLSGLYEHTKDGYLKDESSQNWASVSLYGMYRLPRHFSVISEFGYSFPQKFLYRKSSSHPFLSLHVQKAFPKQGVTLSLAAIDIFNDRGYMKMESFYDDYYQKSWGTKHCGNLILRISYSLRWGNKSSVRRSSSGNMEESGRLSSE